MRCTFAATPTGEPACSGMMSISCGRAKATTSLPSTQGPVGIGQHVVADAQVRALHAAAELVDGAEEGIDERRCRVRVNVADAAGLFHLALVHEHELVGKLERLVLVVGDEQGGDVQLLVQAAEPAAQLLAHLGIERAERLVEQQHARLDRERARKRDALSLAAGELRGVTLGLPIELHEFQELVHAAANFGLGRPLPSAFDTQPEGDILEHGEVAEQRVVLEHEADLALTHVRVRGVLAIDDDLARIRKVEPGDDAQERRLSAPRRAEQRHELAGGDVDAHPVERDEAAEGLADVLNFDGHAASSISTTLLPARHSIIVLITSVTKARSAKSDATAKAAAKLYSL